MRRFLQKVLALVVMATVGACQHEPPQTNGFWAQSSCLTDARCYQRAMQNYQIHVQCEAAKAERNQRHLQGHLFLSLRSGKMVRCQ